VESETFVRIRHRLGLTQEKLAAVIGVHRVTVAVWETGRKPVSLTVARLMECLDRERRDKNRKR
jgi:DNA-binding XRE family transcriptional regulator